MDHAPPSPAMATSGSLFQPTTSRSSFLSGAFSPGHSSSSPSLNRPRLSNRRTVADVPSLESYTTLFSDLLRTRLVRVIVLPGSVLLCVLWIVSASRRAGGVDGIQRGTGRAYARGDFSCEKRGLLSGNSSSSTWDRQRVALRIVPSSGRWDDGLRDGALNSDQLHPAVSAQLARDDIYFYNDTSQYRGELLPSPAYAGKCVVPAVHKLALAPPAPPRAHEPVIHFSVCTTPGRAITMAPVWSHFMSAPAHPAKPSSTAGRALSPLEGAPSCLVTDANGDNDFEAYKKANAAFASNGLRCRMRTSSRVGARYEMRVLGLVHDAWRESERRRWQDGDQMVEWFFFGDDDTLWLDPADARALVAGLDWREDVMLGGMSEAKLNFGNHGRIAYGGAGIVLSRTLLRKLQPFVDKCAARFAHIFGGDGLLTSCVAYVRSIELDEVVHEVDGMSQMDMQGDASGWIQQGRPLFTLHHWWGWLDLVPNKGAMETVLLIGAAARVVGGRNLFRRWTFDDGRVSLSLGFSVTLYESALTRDDLRKAEWTWTDFEPRKPARRGRAERTEKLTYFLSRVEHISPDLALLRHECEDESVAEGIRVVDILWDRRKSGWW